MTARPMTEGLEPCPFCGGDAEVGGYDWAYYARCMDRDCIAGVHAIHFEDDAAAREAWNRRPAAVRGMREALESIRYHSENQDMSHRTFRIKARECADAALSVEGEDEQATRAFGPTAPTDRF